MKSVRESTQEKKPTLVLGGTGYTGQHAREDNVVTSGHRRAAGTITMLLGMVVALTFGTSRLQRSGRDGIGNGHRQDRTERAGFRQVGQRHS